MFLRNDGKFGQCHERYSALVILDIGTGGVDFRHLTFGRTFFDVRPSR